MFISIYPLCYFRFQIILLNRYETNVENVTMVAGNVQNSDRNVSCTVAMLVKCLACSVQRRIFFPPLLMNVYFVNIFCTCLFNSMKGKLHD